MYLLDTNILIFLAYSSEHLTEEVKNIIQDTDNELYFSSASIWKVAIKFSLNKPDFNIDPDSLRKGLFDNGFKELVVKGEHSLNVLNLPESLHKDPFDRMLIAQANHEGFTFITSDNKIIDLSSNFISIISNR
ncbi:type II toxin-antitoxin system VapC family toxin [Pectobacterium peruviense]|uniref:Twitching motility protein PilT n=1 Tax=Pectobacterium peruviense TaxID=2066479 RepID=A0ABX4S2K9_9GAMM|nr:type II toxin-antitoxin system VapC family toxin [Pectobacterium peruviense]KML68996.1 twitching motility protein PilT [Pectobacterium peruviense]PKX83306.1 twitching motility protein PilT [Pectobacterium peruviense]PKX84399.1 twitching motility protein PilT [Pectobacterium peruviense]